MASNPAGAGMRRHLRTRHGAAESFRAGSSPRWAASPLYRPARTLLRRHGLDDSSDAASRDSLRVGRDGHLDQRQDWAPVEHRRRIQHDVAKATTRPTEQPLGVG